MKESFLPSMVLLKKPTDLSVQRDFTSLLV